MVNPTQRKSSAPVATGAKQNRVPPNANPPQVSAQQNPEQSAWGEVESLLIRMLVGTLKFPFVRLPHILFGVLQVVFPVAVRLTGVALLALILGVIVLGPGAYAHYFQEVNKWLADNAPGPVTPWLTTHPTTVQLLGYSWTAIAIIGSIWGAIYVSRKRRSKVSA